MKTLLNEPRNAIVNRRRKKSKVENFGIHINERERLSKLDKPTKKRTIMKMIASQGTFLLEKACNLFTKNSVNKPITFQSNYHKQ